MYKQRKGKSLQRITFFFFKVKWQIVTSIKNIQTTCIHIIQYIHTYIYLHTMNTNDRTSKQTDGRTHARTEGILMSRNLNSRVANFCDATSVDLMYQLLYISCAF